MKKILEPVFDLNKGWDSKEQEPEVSYKYRYTSSIAPHAQFRRIPADEVTELEKLLRTAARERYIKEFHLPPDWEFDLIGVEKD